MKVKHAALCSSGSGKPHCDCGAEVSALRAELALAIDDCRAAQVERDNVRAAYITQIERLRAEAQARLDAIEYLLNTGIFAGNDAEDAQQHAMSIIDAARKGEGERA